DAPTHDAHVPVAQGGEAEGVVLHGIFGIADPRQSVLHETHHCSEDLLARQPRPAEIRCEPTADRRQRPSELEHVPVFRLVPDASPSRVIPMLLAATRIPSRRLQMSVLQWADPYVGPG